MLHSSRKQRKMRSLTSSLSTSSLPAWRMIPSKLVSLFIPSTLLQVLISTRRWWIFWWLQSKNQYSIMKPNFSSSTSTSMFFQFNKWTTWLTSTKTSVITKSQDWIRWLVSTIVSRFLFSFTESAGRLRKNRSTLWSQSVSFFRLTLSSHSVPTLNFKTTSWHYTSSCKSQFSIWLKEKTVLTSCTKWICSNCFSIQLLSRYWIWCTKGSTRCHHHHSQWVWHSNAYLRWTQWV